MHSAQGHTIFWHRGSRASKQGSALYLSNEDWWELSHIIFHACSHVHAHAHELCDLWYRNRSHYLTDLLASFTHNCNHNTLAYQFGQLHD